MSATPRQSISAKQRQAFLKRALTLQKRSAELMDDLVDLLGTEHEATNFADNLLMAADEMVDVLKTKTYDMWNPIVRPVAPEKIGYQD